MEPTWWTVGTKWFFSLEKSSQVSSVRGWALRECEYVSDYDSNQFQMFGVSQPSYIDENLTDLPELENEDSERLRSFVVSHLHFNLSPCNNQPCTYDITSPWYLRRALICEKAILCQWESSETTQRIEHCSPGDIICGLTLSFVVNNPISAC